LTHRRGSAVSVFVAVVVLSVACHSLAGQGFTTSVYEGQITSVRIDKCGLQPGLCEGSIILARPGGGDTAIDLRVGTWIKRDDYFLTIEDLNIGDHVKAQTFRIPGAANPRAAILEFKNP
jgi:hypothetical protein